MGDHTDLWRTGRARRTAGYQPRHTPVRHVRRQRAGRRLAVFAVLAVVLALGVALTL